MVLEAEASAEAIRVRISYISVTVKFVVSRCAFCELRKDFGFFCSVNHESEWRQGYTDHSTICAHQFCPCENGKEIFQQKIQRS